MKSAHLSFHRVLLQINVIYLTGKTRLFIRTRWGGAFIFFCCQGEEDFKLCDWRLRRSFGWKRCCWLLYCKICTRHFSPWFISVDWVCTVLLSAFCLMSLFNLTTHRILTPMKLKSHSPRMGRISGWHSESIKRLWMDVHFSPMSSATTVQWNSTLGRRRRRIFLS